MPWSILFRAIPFARLQESGKPSEPLSRANSMRARQYGRLPSGRRGQYTVPAPLLMRTPSPVTMPILSIFSSDAEEAVETIFM